MTKRAVRAAALAVVCLAYLVPGMVQGDAKAASLPKLPSGWACAGQQLPARFAKTHVLATLQVYVSGRAQLGPALPVKLWNLRKSRVVGYAFTVCYTAVPVKPGTVGRRPNLCIQVGWPFVPYSTNTRDLAAACPKPDTYRIGSIRWVRYIFKVRLDPRLKR